MGDPFVKLGLKEANCEGELWEGLPWSKVTSLTLGLEEKGFTVGLLNVFQGADAAPAADPGAALSRPRG